MKIFAIGDSHSIFFHNSKDIIEHWGFENRIPLTWFSLIKSGIDIYNIGTLLGNGHEKNNPNVGDYILFCYGWNDIQRNIYKHTAGIEDYEIHNLIDKYINYLCILQEKYKIIPIVSCIYPNHHPEAKGVNSLGTCEERLKYIKIANKYLKKTTFESKLLYWDIYDFITDSSGFIKKEYTKDLIHLDYNNSYLRETIDNKLIELTLEKKTMQDFGFIIPTCIKEKIHLQQLIRCINSIRKFHKNNYIILICNCKIYDMHKLMTNQKNIVIKDTLNEGSEDQQSFQILLETTLFTKAIFIQDSMLLNKRLENIENVSLQFLWHFTNHILQWDTIKEPKTSYNELNNIISHNDLICHNILRDYTDNKEFQNYVINKLNKKNEWCGCFGNLCIIDKTTLTKLNDNNNFIEKFVKATNNRDRRANESIFALICHYNYSEINFEESYDGLYFDGKKHAGKYNMTNKDTGFDNLKWCAVNEYFSKISFNR